MRLPALRFRWARLKPVTARLDLPPMTAALRRFIDWIAAYTLSPPGEVLAMALRANSLAPQIPAPWLGRLGSPRPPCA